jgi:DNA mismatch repair protein MutL
MGQIRVLPPALVSRIAAGECIERPASVVKELVENALDAGAGRIDIDIADGGRARIQVTDDGCGMDAEDLALSVRQHATSKLHDDEDLFRIRTLGFRGEALASIGAVARMRIVSRRKENEVGAEIRVEGGQITGPRPCAAPPGTTVEVRDLFYSVPARRKFLRTNQTEVGHITEQFARIALAHPQVAFTLRNQERVTYRLEATSDRRQRIADFYGEELARVLLPVRREGHGVLVEGLVAPPAESRASGKWEYVFVNGRYVRDRFVSHAVREAYRSLIDPTRFPVVFLFLTVEPEAVDVNVHPMKVEVRWRDSNYVHGQVLAALRDKFLTSRLDHTLEPTRDDEAYRERVRAAMVDFFTHAPRVEPAGVRSEPSQVRSEPTDRPASRAGHFAGRPEAVPIPRSAMTNAGTAEALPRVSDDLDRASEIVERHPPAAPADVSTGTGTAPSLAGTPAVRAIQIHNSYLVAETDDGLMIVDQHALHERILYEELRRRVAMGRLESQRLLIPEIVRVPADRLEALETHQDLLARLGIELAAAGPQSVALHAFPTLLERIDVTGFVRDLLDRLAEHGAHPDPDTLLHDLLDMMACKAAVKAGDPLTSDEIDTLLQRCQLAERSSHCPHGRPTTLRLSLRDLERQFHRR